MRSSIFFIALVVIFAIFSSAASAQEVKWRMEDNSIVKYEELLRLPDNELDTIMKELGIKPLTNEQINVAARDGLAVEPTKELVRLFPPIIERKEVVLTLDENGRWAQELRATSYESSLLAWVILGLVTLFVAACTTSNQKFWLPIGSIGFAVGVTIGIISQGSPFGVFLGIAVGFLFGMIPSRDGDFHLAAMPTLIGAVATTFLLSGETGITTPVNVWGFGWLCVFFAGFEVAIGLFIRRRRAARQASA